MVFKGQVLDIPGQHPVQYLQVFCKIFYISLHIIEGRAPHLEEGWQNARVHHANFHLLDLGTKAAGEQWFALPAILVGLLLGFLLERRISTTLFRRAVLIALIVLGLNLVF